MSLIIDLADAIVADLKAADFGIVIPWERSYADWDLELKDPETTDPRGDVVPVMDGDVQLANRGVLEIDADIVIAIRKRFKASDVDEVGRLYKDEIDSLVNVMQAVLVHLVKGRPINDAAWKADKSKQVRAWYDRDALKNKSQFTGMIRLPYRVLKSLA